MVARTGAPAGHRWPMAVLAMLFAVAAQAAESEVAAATVAPGQPDTKVATLSLAKAVSFALDRNLRLQAEARQVDSAEALERRARSVFRPAITVTASQVALDRDRAEASLGRAPEYRTSAGLELRQLLFSDAARADLEVSRKLHNAGGADEEEERLATIAATGHRYLSLLEAEAQYRILADDLRLTDSNYERARVRLDLGVGNRAEVYRWQARQANARNRVRSAEAAATRARVELNLVMNQPLARRYEVEEPSREDHTLLISDDAIWARLVAGDRRDALRDYCLAEAAAHSPVLRALALRREAQERRLLQAKRTQRVPSVDLTMNAVQHVAEGGVGTEQFSFTIPGTGTRVGGQTDDTEWTAAVVARLPLYKGGARRAEIDRERVELERTSLLYDAAKQRLEADVLARLARFEASLDGIEFARAAADASRRNLDLVGDAYERGVVTIIDLLDAQVAALTAELSAANSLYRFMHDYLDLQYSMGRFDIVMGAEEREAALARLKSSLI